MFFKKRKQKLEALSKTPNGGAYSKISYFDNQGHIVEKDKATKCIINEYSEDGKVIFTTYGNIGSPK